jgi:hypothetical protein
MSIIVPIVLVSLAIGVFAKRMTATLWMLVAVVIVVSAARFYMAH